MPDEPSCCTGRTAPKARLSPRRTSVSEGRASEGPSPPRPPRPPRRPRPRSTPDLLHHHQQHASPCPLHSGAQPPPPQPSPGSPPSAPASRRSRHHSSAVPFHRRPWCSRASPERARTRGRRRSRTPRPRRRWAEKAFARGAVRASGVAAVPPFRAEEAAMTTTLTSLLPSTSSSSPANLPPRRLRSFALASAAEGTTPAVLLCPLCCSERHRQRPLFHRSQLRHLRCSCYRPYCRCYRRRRPRLPPPRQHQTPRVRHPSAALEGVQGGSGCTTGGNRRG